jgi:hypothetical protein
VKSNCYDLTLTESDALGWPSEEPAPWTPGARGPRRRGAEKAERRAAAKAAHPAATARHVATAPRLPEDTDPEVRDSAISRASGWFFMPPQG